MFADLYSSTLSLIAVITVMCVLREGIDMVKKKLAKK